MVELLARPLCLKQVNFRMGRRRPLIWEVASMSVVFFFLN